MSALKQEDPPPPPLVQRGNRIDRSETTAAVGSCPASGVVVSQGEGVPAVQSESVSNFPNQVHQQASRSRPQIAKVSFYPLPHVQIPQRAHLQAPL